MPISALALLEPPVATVKSIQLENRTGDNSAVAGPAILASVSNHLKDLSAVHAASAGENNQRVARSIVSLASGKSESQGISPDKEFENGENTNMLF